MRRFSDAFLRSLLKFDVIGRAFYFRQILAARLGNPLEIFANFIFSEALAIAFNEIGKILLRRTAPPGSREILRRDSPTG